ncbi:MAG: hypothetical protein Q4A52_07555 [Bacillota bacterium]|nr:hypothetical protein [Bacillota bacterium]
MTEFDKRTLPAFLALNPLYVETIDEGFRRHRHELLEGEREIRLTLNKYYLLDGDASYVDLYYGALTAEEKRRVEAELTPDEIALLHRLDLSPEELFVRLTPQLFELCIKLSLTENLFCTFYFLRSGCTVWGNYAHKFPIFYRG